MVYTCTYNIKLHIDALMLFLISLIQRVCIILQYIWYPQLPLWYSYLHTTSGDVAIESLYEIGLTLPISPPPASLLDRAVITVYITQLHFYLLFLASPAPGVSLYCVVHRPCQMCSRSTRPIYILPVEDQINSLTWSHNPCLIAHHNIFPQLSVCACVYYILLLLFSPLSGMMLQ